MYIRKKTNDTEFKTKGYILLPSNFCTGCTRHLVPKIAKMLRSCPNYYIIASINSESFRNLVTSTRLNNQLIIDETGVLDRVRGVSGMLICSYDDNGVQRITKLNIDNYENVLSQVSIDNCE